ncbi:MAG: PqiC family protein [Candidatus Omnitrophota bacterium]
MKQIVINDLKSPPLSFRMVMSGVCLTLALSGCISVSNSPTPRFYMLQAVHENQASPVRGCDFNESKFAFNGASKKINIVSDALIGVGPVKIPEYQNRPQMVTQNKKNMLTFAQFDRWGESLDLGVARLIGEELTGMLPGMKCIVYPWNSALPVKYQVVVEIVQMESELDKDLFIAAQWLVIDAKNTKTMVIKRSEFRQPIIPQDYSGLVKTISEACASLSGEIAEALATLENRPKTKERAPVSKK